MKAELNYAGMRVKELAEQSGVKKQTIDSYLRENNYTPSAENAVGIARALGVSVEYLVMGKDAQKGPTLSSLGHDLRLLIKSLDDMNEKDRRIVIDNALNLVRVLHCGSRKRGV
ncbi:MAG: helix-turn-helix transcriptional regulator [Treponema sp.]|nr:helix-turn-helix transcriptional regulator [Treponema sp.]